MIRHEELAALRESALPHALLDLREPAAYAGGHIFRATSLPRRLLEFRLTSLVPARSTPLVLYDGAGTLSALARPTVEEMGYTNVRVLAGGLVAWRAAGRRTVQGVNVPSKVFGEEIFRRMKTPLITPLELHARMRAGADLVVVDVRTPEEYRTGSIPGAWSVPGGELVLRIADLVERPEATIVVHCAGRTRSCLGVESLRRARLPNPVLALQNGTMGWLLAGLELERAPARLPGPVSARSREVAQEVARGVAMEDLIVSVSADRLRTLIALGDHENVYVIDVRPREEYDAGHIPGSIWAPGGQAVQAADEYVAVRSGELVFVCDGLVRSVMAASWFRRMGFPRVSVLEGGFPAWIAAGGQVESGHPEVVPFGWHAARAAASRIAPGRLENAMVLNVDDSRRYAAGHVPGAVWICRSRLEIGLPRAVRDRGQRIVATCATGMASTLAAATLARLGFDHTSVLAGGTRAWQRAGLPIERGMIRAVDEPDDVVPRPWERGRRAMEAYLRWEEHLDREGASSYSLAEALERPAEPSRRR